MESGTVRINNGVGRIDTGREPSPVSFAPESFPRIVDGADVIFERAASQADWAVRVVLADTVNALVLHAIPIGGLTPGAQTLLIEKAAQFVEHAQAAPSAELERAHLEFGHATMKSIADKAKWGAGRIGMRTVTMRLK